LIPRARTGTGGGQGGQRKGRKNQGIDRKREVGQKGKKGEVTIKRAWISKGFE